MWRWLGSRTPWLPALACAASAAYFLRDHQAALYIAPALSLFAVLLLWLRPWAGGIVAVGGAAAELLLGVPAENPSWLATMIVTFYQLGRQAPAWHGALLAASTAGSYLVLEREPVSQRLLDAVFLTFVVAAAWAFGRAVRRRADGAAHALAEAQRLAAEDTATVIAHVIEEERRRLAAELVGVVTQAVTAMRADAERAAATLDTEAIASITSRGAGAMSELRRLIGLLRADPEDAGADHAAENAATEKRRRPLAAAVAALALGTVWVAEMLSLPGEHNPLSLWAVAAVVAAVWLRQRHPVAAATVLLLPILGSLWFGGPDPGVGGLAGSLALALVAWSIGTHADLMGFAVVGLLGVVAVLHGHEQDPGNEAITIAWIGLPLVCGYLWTHFESQQEAEERRTGERQAEIDAEVARAVAEDRLRLARELHDVTSHALGVMVLQAGAAEATAESKPHVARAALAQAMDAGDQALKELAGLDRMIGPARAYEDAGSFGASLAGLLDRMRAAGLLVTAEVEAGIDAGPFDPLTGQTAYRVVQEALTNVARHAKGARVTLRITENDEGLQITVADDGRPAVAHGGPAVVTTKGSGFGLVGLAERLRALGGTLAAGPGSDGGFSVHAVIPRSKALRPEGLTQQRR